MDFSEIKICYLNVGCSFSTDLLIAVTRYIRLNKLKKNGMINIEYYESDINRLMKYVEPALSNLAWLFTNQRDKEYACQAFDKLEQIYSMYPMAEQNNKVIMNKTILIKINTNKSTILKSVEMPGVQTIGENAFYGCIKLTSIILPSQANKIGANVFKNCKKLKTIIIKSKDLTAIGKNAFKGVGSSYYKKVEVKVPAKKLKSYRTLLKKAGLSSKAKVKK